MKETEDFVLVDHSDSVHVEMEEKRRIEIEMAGYVFVNLVDIDFDFVEMEEKPRIEIEMAELSKGAEVGWIKAKNKMAELSK
mmetsp:Transcript_82189/g.166538  ORF Transcript_82189/g.166538 Transcript_82189/m.166538 type:complete len:82 (+) Transcript_82189:111-356(+)|eukprot:CAMPEP_0201199310 /NCGR_PEP_ID=MMETSP0851-20130426/158619_1 /ASSEMBLY_ACC=CAM_ASM_000631 /TAXON_ID=183588 /ORGANISM="Pseudo-nitzschia fraudulenta, Strain WWA7" /LENGTH=81 /DNA_ID=CAMNT_0047486697 /DNA_START=111 /DNA_END=356 /DNA_ORIENTATION=+